MLPTFQPYLQVSHNFSDINNAIHIIIVIIINSHPGNNQVNNNKTDPIINTCSWQHGACAIYQFIAFQLHIYYLLPACSQKQSLGPLHSFQT